MQPNSSHNKTPQTNSANFAATDTRIPLSFRRRVRPKPESGPPSVQLLCQRIAFIYQRLSTTEQKKNSRYSLERQDDLERMAREDGYPDSLIYVERRDLGISGTKGQDEREGLAYLISLIEQGKVESVYVIEISRISRDQTLITGLQFGELCREHGIIIVTPTMRLNLRDEMHMRMYRYEIDRAAEELKSIRFRMQGAKDMKAKHGYAVGGSVPSGYIIDNEERLPNGSPNPNFQKYKIYEPHTEIVRLLFRMMARPGAHYKSVSLECKNKGIVFPKFPDELLAIKGNATSFVQTKKDANGNYPITRKRVESIVTNPAYIGWFIWSGQVISKENHPPIIDEETFWAVQRKSKVKGVKRTEFFDPMPLAGLLYCAMHTPPRRMIGSNSKIFGKRRYLCNDTDHEETCATFTAYMLEDPIAELIISQCSFPGYTDQVLQQLTTEHEAAKEKAAANKREYQRIMAELANLEANLTRTTDRAQVDFMLNLVSQKLARKEELTRVENQPMGKVLSAIEVQTVQDFLTNLDTGWDKMTDEAKNIFLSLMLERVDITHDAATIVASVTWRTGLQQTIEIERPLVDTRRDWTEQEDSIIRTKYPSSSQLELRALLPGRTWGAICRRGSQLGIDRPIEMRQRVSSKDPFTEEEDQTIRDFHAFKTTREEMRNRLAHRSEDAIWRRARQMGFQRRQRYAKWRLLSADELKELAEEECGDSQEVSTLGGRSKTKLWGRFPDL